MATINPAQDYDMIQTLTFAAASGTCKIILLRGSASSYTGTVKVREGTSGTWSDLSVSSATTTFYVTNTTMQVAHDWNKSGNDYMTCSFQGQRTNLTGIAISQKAILSGVIGNYFMADYANGCTNLTSLDVPDTSGITSVGNNFMNRYARFCSNLTSLGIPDTSNVTGSVGTNFITYYAGNCTALTTLYLPSVGWFATHDVNWGVPSGRLSYLKGNVLNSADLSGWQALTTSTSPNTLYLNYIRNTADVYSDSESFDKEITITHSIGFQYSLIPTKNINQVLSSSVGDRYTLTFDNDFVTSLSSSIGFQFNYTYLTLEARYGTASSSIGQQINLEFNKNTSKELLSSIGFQTSLTPARSIIIGIYFDDVLIDTDSYIQLDNDYKLFTDSFKLGSVASDTFSLGVIKNAVSTQPVNVRIEDDTTIFNFVVDKIVEDDNVYTYSLTDKLLNFNFEYDASVLIHEKAENEEECYLSDIWKDMCLQANVEYDETYVFENDIIVNWYDNRVQARRYLSFIAELQSGYACMLDNGKQSFKKQKRSSVKTIDADECSDLIVGEKKKITRVVFDGGAFKWEFGDNTGDTLYLQSDNVYIVNEEIVENIYNNIKDFEFYIINCPQAPMDSTVKAGDVITFNDNGTLYPTIAQYKMSYNGGWSGGYKLQVNTERQQETQVTRTADNVRNLQVNVDRLNNEFGIIAEDIKKLTDYIRNVGTTGNYLKLTDTPKSGGAINTLSIKGFELRELYPGMAYPSEYTFPGVLNFYTLIFDTVPTFDNEPNYVFVNSPIPLQKLGSVYDELLIESNKAKVIQRIGYDFINEQWSVLSTPIIHELNDVLLPTFEGDTYISVRYFDNLVYDAEYLIKNDLTSNFATQLESSSQFKLNQNEIEAKVNKDGIISSINLSPEEIKILAERIKIEGLTTINENFKVLLDGSIEAVNAKLTGDIFLPNGGRVIGGDGILGNLTASTHRTLLGYGQVSHEGVGLYRGYIEVELYIPEMFTIVEAYITVQTFRTRNFYLYPESTGDTDEYGKVQNIKLYKISNNIEVVNSTLFGWFDYDDPSGSEISGAFGADGYTSLTSDGETVTSADISNNLDKGFNIFVLKTSNAIPNPSSDAGVLQASKETQFATVTLSVIGYMRSDKE